MKPPYAFRSKAQTLTDLRAAGFAVPELRWISWGDWQHLQLRQNFLAYFDPHNTYAVRSSKMGEDSADDSQAGAFESLLHIRGTTLELEEAVHTVFASYGQPNAHDEVLIQEMVLDVEICGVVMTRVPEDGAPYYVVDYDDETGRTDTVTGGLNSRVVYVHHHSRPEDFDSERIRSAVELAQELVTWFGESALDIEFAQNTQRRTFVLQARPITTQAQWDPQVEERVNSQVPLLEDLIGQLQQVHPALLGRRTLWGVMPDWNPAEIIGIHPRPLDVSLYRYLITRKSWAKARQEMGYAKFQAPELMIVLAGRPYVDVRASLNSFLPAGLDRPLGEKWLDLQLDRLELHPEFHDKIEFEICSTAWNFDLESTLEQRYGHALNPSERQRLIRALYRQTVTQVNPDETGTLAQAIQTAQSLAWVQRDYATPSGAHSLLAQVRRVLDDCVQFGAVPFAIMARHAFIAEDWLRSLSRIGILTEARTQELRESVPTISGRMSADFALAQTNPESRTSFLAEYGHLRPGTYDVLSPRYDARGEDLFQAPPASEIHSKPAFVWSIEEAQRLNNLFLQHELSVDANSFQTYVENAIAWREQGKFIFTRSLSLAMEQLATWASLHGFNRDALSWLSVDQLFPLLATPALSELPQKLENWIAQGQNDWHNGLGLKFGYLIRGPRDVRVVPQHRSAPNFITRKKFAGPVTRISSRDVGKLEPSGTIACIESADPGYDWLFAHGIAALVTQYGGANSHMAIRCREYGIPAAIGCGEALFAKISRSSYASIDAEAHLLQEGLRF